MDLTTLPKEMLANILKHQDYAQIYKLRTMNSYVNHTVQRFHQLKAIPLKRLQISCTVYADWEMSLSLNEQIVKDLSWITGNHSRKKGFAEKIDKLICKSEELRTKLFELSRGIPLISELHLRNVQLGDSLLSAIEYNKESFQKCTQLHLTNPETTLSTPNMKKFLELFPKLSTIKLKEENTWSSYQESHAKLNTEVLGNRKWECIVVDSWGEISYTPLDDKFLLAVVLNCKEFKFISKKGRTLFTFQGIIEMIKENCALRLSKSCLDVGNIGLGELTIAALENILKTCREINNYDSFDNKENSNIRCYTVYFGIKHSSLNFAVKKSALTERTI